MTTLILTKEKAQALVWDDDDDYEVIKTEQTGSSRWSIHYEAIFCPRGKQNEGPWYKVSYRSGATECQDERPFEYETEVHATEVVPVQVMAIEWQNKPTTIEKN